MTGLQILLVVCGICAGVAAVFTLLWLGNNHIKTSRYNVGFGGIEKQIRIVQVSDLHGKQFGAHNCKLVAEVKKCNPDIIAITGDLIHRYSPQNIRTALETVSTLSAVAPVLYVSGNHEMRNKGYRFFRKELKEAGAVVLDNSVIEICGITVVGLNGAHNKNGTLSQITPCAKYKLLLAHMPHYFKNYAGAGYDLVLCGHAHGGQWRIPFLKRGIYSPGQGFFPKYTEGIHRMGKTEMIISRGLGNSEFPFRLFNRPELVEVILSPEKQI